MDFKSLTDRFNELKEKKKEDLEQSLEKMETEFYDATGMDLRLIARSYKTALTGTHEEKRELREYALEEGKEREYWLGYGASVGDRGMLAVLLEVVGKRTRVAKYAARVMASYIATDFLLHAVDRSVIGLIREGADRFRDTKDDLAGKVKEKTEELRGLVHKKEEGPAEREEIDDWLDGVGEREQEEPSSGEDESDLW